MRFAKMIGLGLIAALLLGWVARPAAASEGFYLGLQMPFDFIRGDFNGSDLPTVDTGAGIGVIAGYGFTPDFSAEMDWSVSSHNSEGATIDFAEFSINAKYLFGESPQAAPFLIGGIGSYTLGDSSLRFGGSGYNLGLGVDFYLAPGTTFGVALIRKFITYDRIVESDVPLVLLRNINGDTTTLRFDLTAHF